MNNNKKSVDGRHKAGHDDGVVAGVKPMTLQSTLIVMAGLVPAIHGLFLTAQKGWA